MDEDPLRLFLQDHAEPHGHYAQRAGHWITEPSWPSPNIDRRAYTLGSDGRLGGDAQPDDRLRIASPLRVGSHAGKWCSCAKRGDQRHEHAGSLVFETAPLAEETHIAGDPAVMLTLEVDRPVAQVAARLMNVAPDGAATRVSFGVLNLTHRDSHETPEALVPGETCTAEIGMKHVAQSFRAGHRIRLGLSICDFPIIWPAPEPVTLTLIPARCALSLPIRTGDLTLPDRFDPPRAAEPLPVDYDIEPHSGWSVTEDRDTGRVVVELFDHEGAALITPHDLFHSSDVRERYSVLPDDPLSADGQVVWVHKMSRGDWSVKTVTDTHLTCDREAFHITARLQAWEGETLVRDLDWTRSIPRHLV